MVFAAHIGSITKYGQKRGVGALGNHLAFAHIEVRSLDDDLLYQFESFLPFAPRISNSGRAKSLKVCGRSLLHDQSTRIGSIQMYRLYGVVASPRSSTSRWYVSIKEYAVVI